MADPALHAGQVVELNDGRRAQVCFVGDTAFAPGVWVGVAFADASGKNDGAVQGTRYFDAAPGHGMFLRPAGVARVLEQTQPTQTQPKAAPTTQQQQQPKANGKVGGLARPRPSSIAADARRGSIPAGRISPPKRPTSTSTAAPPRSRPSLAGTQSKRPSLAPAASTSSAPNRTGRPSLAGAPSGLARTGTSSPLKPPSTRAPSSTPKPASPALSRPPKAPSASSGASTTTGTVKTTGATAAAAEKHNVEFETKLRVLEKQRGEDRERLKTLEKVQQERDKFEIIIQKLQAKYQPQQQEVAELRRQLKEAESHLESIEAIQAEHDSILEMATLDREMAEEQAEGMKTELEALKSKMEEMQLENEILRDENQELGQEMSPEERTSKGWLQMERENDRLREALLRLRDMAQEQDAELKDQIKGLEDDVQELATVKQEYETTRERMLECEADIDDLKSQLEAALGAEEMIEELSEKNMALSESIEELKATIDDLQNLKELNDELEINHVENEKQLQEVIDYKDMVITEQGRRGAQRDDTVADQEYTITRFRELVVNLQSDLEDMRASKEISESEAQDLTTRSRAMMDLNRQLAASATNTKVKTIEMELRKLEAQEASEHLEIVQLFLPDAFRSERDSVLALLRFKRIDFKANLVHHFVRDKVAADGPRAHEDDVFDACDALDKLTWIAAMCQRFINRISSCSLEQFASFEGALYELEPVERALNGYIEGLKKDELKETQVAEELQRSIAVMTHLAENRLDDSLESYADNVVMRTLLMQSHLENTAAAIALVNAEVQHKIPTDADDDEDGVVLFAQRADAMVSQMRSAKVVVGKTVHSLQELKARSLSLRPDTLESFEQPQAEAQELAAYTRKIGEAVYVLLHEEGRPEPLLASDVRAAIIRATASFFSPRDPPSSSDPFATLATDLRTLTDHLAHLHALATDLDLTTEFERGSTTTTSTSPSPSTAAAPWVQRARALAASKLVSADADAELRRLRDGAHERATQLRLRDQALDEQAVKIELLERRAQDAARKAARVAELERAAADARAEQTRLDGALHALRRRGDELEMERDRWRDAAAETSRSAPANAAARNRGGAEQDGAAPDGDQARATDREVRALRAEVRVLEATTRHLRRAAHAAEVAEVRRRDTWLEVPLAPSLSMAAEDGEGGGEGERVKECRAVFEELAGLPGAVRPVRILGSGTDGDGVVKGESEKTAGKEGKGGRLAWRPMSSTPQYQIARLEEWDVCASWEALRVPGMGRVGLAVS